MSKRKKGNDSGKKSTREHPGPELYTDPDEAFEAAFRDAFPKPPKGAKYRVRDFDLMNEGTLLLVEEVLPGDPKKKRSFTLEAPPKREVADPRKPAVWKAPIGSPGCPSMTLP